MYGARCERGFLKISLPYIGKSAIFLFIRQAILIHLLKKKLHENEYFKCFYNEYILRVLCIFFIHILPNISFYLQQFLHNIHIKHFQFQFKTGCLSVFRCCCHHNYAKKRNKEKNNNKLMLIYSYTILLISFDKRHFRKRQRWKTNLPTDTHMYMYMYVWCIQIHINIFLNKK